MKKKTVIEYLTPIEFITCYTKKGYEPEKEIIEEKTGMELIQVIAAVAEKDDTYFNNILPKLVEFAEEVGYKYCYECQLLHEYGDCPFCLLNIEV